MRSSHIVTLSDEKVSRRAMYHHCQATRRGRTEMYTYVVLHCWFRFALFYRAIKWQQRKSLTSTMTKASHYGVELFRSGR